MEKVSIIYQEIDNGKRKKVKGIMIVDEIEMGYIRPKIVFYVEKGTFEKRGLIDVLKGFKQNVANIPNLMETLDKWLKSDQRTHDMVILKPFTLISNNKNKSSRNKNIMTSLEITNYERITVNYVGKKIT
jgi:hypothetical protein